MPTTYVHGIVPAPTRMHWPSASWPGQSAFAIALLTTAARGAPATSSCPMPRPRSMRVPMVAK
ncbi:MAG TPA: hypothetical protein VF041_13435 [Gemmatimonadaceae bacterium]